jgi:hypothetical protein
MTTASRASICASRRFTSRVAARLFEERPVPFDDKGRFDNHM